MNNTEGKNVMKIMLSQLRRVIREEVLRTQRRALRETKDDRFDYPASVDALRSRLQMVAGAAFDDAEMPDSKTDALARRDMSRLWQNVEAERNAGTPWAEVAHAYIHDFLIEIGIDEDVVQDILRDITKG